MKPGRERETVELENQDDIRVVRNCLWDVGETHLASMVETLIPPIQLGIDSSMLVLEAVRKSATRGSSKLIRRQARQIHEDYIYQS